MASVNKIIVIGNVGRDPELRYTANGKSMVNFSVATNHRFQRPDGEWDEQTEWFRVVAWGPVAERATERLEKGAQAYVEGRLQTRTWTDREGKERKEVEIIASQITRLDRRGELAPAGTGYSGGSRGGESDVVDPDDLPFD